MNAILGCSNSKEVCRLIQCKAVNLSLIILKLLCVTWNLCYSNALCFMGSKAPSLEPPSDLQSLFHWLVFLLHFLFVSSSIFRTFSFPPGPRASGCTGRGYCTLRVPHRRRTCSQHHLGEKPYAAPRTCWTSQYTEVRPVYLNHVSTTNVCFEC